MFWAVIASSFLPSTGKIQSLYQAFTCEWDYRITLNCSAGLKVFLWKKTSGFCHKGINYPSTSGRHRPTEYPAVSLSKPDDALYHLFPHQAESYLHGKLLVKTLAYFLQIPCFLQFLVLQQLAHAGALHSSQSPSSPMQTTAGRHLRCHSLPRAGCLPLPRIQGTSVTSAAAVRPPARSQTSPRGAASQTSLLTTDKCQRFFSEAVWEGGR